MIDWTFDAAADYWHDVKRQPLVEDGVVGHWVDLGEPEMYDAIDSPGDPADWARGVLPDGHAHADWHNAYNLKWAEGIAGGYRRHGVARRPFVVSRTGTAGIQRHGVAMTSGDIGSNLESLASHLNVQMHMSLSGVDYFGSDVGGFLRRGLTGEPLDDLYTRWFATSAFIDVPLRPHTENLCNCKEIMAGTIFGLVQMVLEGYIYYPLQIILDYPLAFACLGLAGIFKKIPLLGVIVSLTGRFLSHFISGVVFFAEYAPPEMGPYVYSAIYNGSYILGEMVISGIIIYLIWKRMPQVLKI